MSNEIYWALIMMAPGVLGLLALVALYAITVWGMTRNQTRNR